MVVSDDVKYERLESIITESGKGFIESVELLDVYKGEQIGPRKASLTISMVFRSHEKTLTDEEVNSVLDRVKKILADDLNASIR